MRQRPLRVILTLAAAICLWPTALRAQQATPPRSSDAPVFFPAIQYGAPLRISAGLGVFLPTGDNRSAARGQGVMIEASAGQGGIRGSVGRFVFEEYFGVDARAVVLRTWGSPRSASANATYAGVEGGVSIAYVRVSMGVARRLSGATGAHATVLLWNAGLQLPISTR